MVDLKAKSPCAGLLPLHIGALTLEELTPGSLTSLAAYNGKAQALSDALEHVYGMPSPQPNRSTTSGTARALWFGQNMLLLMGPDPDPSLTQHAAATDQSDAWAVVELSGPGARDVLARLTPLDLRDAIFQTGHTARTDIRHMMGDLTRTGEDTWMIMVFRGFAETLVHDLRVAMETVTAR